MQREDGRVPPFFLYNKSKMEYNYSGYLYRWLMPMTSSRYGKMEDSP